MSSQTPISNTYKTCTVSWADDEFWNGPFGVLVPDSVTKVKDTDGINMRYKNGSSTEMVSGPLLSEAEYKARYAVLEADGNYYYKTD
jgi:hypothetical protein